jgi:hypothetical protein
MLMTKAESDKLEVYKDGNKYRVEPIHEPRLHISGGFNTTTSDHTLVFHPSNYTTNSLTVNTSNNVGIGTINPTTQLSVNGDLEVRDGNIRMIDFNGAETMRITSNGETLVTAPDGRRYINGIIQQPEQPTQEYNHYDRPLTTEDQMRIIRELASELNDGDRVAADAQQRLDDAMAEQLAEANERVAEKHLSLLDNIELGTVEQRMIDRMQRLAGIQTREQRLAELDAERARIEQQARRNGEEAAEQARIEREALLEQINIDMAEQPVVPSKQRKNIWNQIKSLWSK